MDVFSVTDLCNIVNGSIVGQIPSEKQKITEIITDSRTFYKGNNAVFIALKGLNHDGHKYIPQVRKKGVLTFLISEKVVDDDKATYILVENTTRALQQLAAYVRNLFAYPVVGITGSNGKTIVKEWLHDILSGQFLIIRSPKSYNSQVGVPLSVLLMSSRYNLGVFEAGISQPGEMELLAPIISPEIGIFTNLGDAHQENFQTLKDKLNEKLKLFKNCKQLIFRADKSYSKQVSDFCSKNNISAFSWSMGSYGVQILFSSLVTDNRTEITAKTSCSDYKFVIPFTDDSALENACHCFAASMALGVSPEKIVDKFKELQPVAMRLEIKRGINNCLLINDYYNSDLNSLTIALSVLKQQAASDQLHKQVILSDIQQTGIEPAELYKKVDRLLIEWGIDKLIGIGHEIFVCGDSFSIDAEFYASRIEFEHNFNRNNFKNSALLIKGARNFEFEKISGLLQQKAHRSVLEINLNALADNLNTFRRLLKPETRIMVMVKAFSYGSGDVEIARVLQYQNVDYLAVAVADEGVQLRNAGIETPIIVMNPEHDSFQNMIDFCLEPNIYSSDLLRQFAKAVSENGKHHFPIHLKIDTGMNRLGLKTDDEISEIVQIINHSNLFKVESVFSHLVGSDEPILDDFTGQQFSRFEHCIEIIENSLDYKFCRHILNSAGIERFAGKQMDMVRLGIGLYGISPTGMQLEVVGTLKSTVSHVKTVSANETIGYGRKGKLFGDSQIATVPMGYADGINRRFGNRNGSAFVNGCKVPIVGNICMDMLMLDITGIQVKPGDSVEFFGSNIPITELAEEIDTIPYEILTGISQRVKRVYVQE